MHIPADATTAIEGIDYAISLREILWGVSLVALTMAIHGFGVTVMLRVAGGLERRIQRRKGFLLGLGILILSTWMLMFVHLFEVFVWAAFFFWKQAFTNPSICYYFALNEYTTLGSNYSLPQDWRLLEGCIATAGLLTFAWSTGALLPLLQAFQKDQLRYLTLEHGGPEPAATPPPGRRSVP